MKTPNRCRAEFGIRIGLFVCLVVALLGMPDAADAIKGRTLGGYRFMPSSTVEDPFITTHFRNFTGLSIATDVTVPILAIDSVPVPSINSIRVMVNGSSGLLESGDC